MKRDAFEYLLEMQAEYVRLDCAALHLARDVYPQIDIPFYVRRLDALARQVAECRPGLTAPLRYKALHEVLVGQHCFGGDTDDFYNPKNSYLNRVLDHQKGIPISLSTVWIEVGRRLKWPVAGVGFPGHFLVRIDDPERFVLVDPFRDGRTLSLQDCRKIHEHCFDRSVRFRPDLLRPVGVRQILIRTLRNLRAIYLSQQNWPRLERVLERLAFLEPRQSGHVQELAGLHYRLGRYPKAYAALADYLERVPDAEDAGLVQQRLAHLEAVIASTN